MKVTVSIGLCTMVVLLQLMQTPMAQLQVCSNRPSCRRRGTYLNSQSCQCEGTTPSTCRPGFNAVVDPHGFCSCESRTTPTCKPGFTIETYPCQCTIDVEPTCPTGSSITNEDARCTGTATPMCPRGATLHGCKCVKEYVRECAVGELSWDGCECSESYPPTCSSGCTLNSNGCSCDGEYGGGIVCYSNNDCSGHGFLVTSVNECCQPPAGGPLQLSESQNLILPSGWSYRNGNGPCSHCYH